MLTLSAAQDELRIRNDPGACLFVSIVTAAGTFYFAEKTLNLTGLTAGSQFQNITLSIAPLSHGFDYNSLVYQPSRTTIILSNLWTSYENIVSSYKFKRVSGYLVTGGSLDLIGSAVTVYWYPGAYVTALSDCLAVFTGTVTRADTVGESRIELSVDERAVMKHVMLPKRLAARGDFPSLPTQNIDRTLPIVYGTHFEDAFLRHYGFAVGLKIDRWKWVIADHVIDQFYSEPRIGASATQAVWMFIPEMGTWARSYTGVTFDEDDGGQATVEIDPVNVGFDMYLYPTVGTQTSTGSDGSNPVGEVAAFDNDDTTKFSLIANSTTQAEIIFEWHQHSDEEISDPAVGPGTDLTGIQMYISKPGGITITSSALDYWGGSTWVSISTSIDVATANLVHYDKTVADLLSGLRFHFASGVAGGDETPFKIRIRFGGSGWTANTTVVAYIHELRFVRSMKLPRRLQYGVAIKQDYPNPFN